MWTIETALVGLNTLAVVGTGAAWLFGKRYGDAYMAKKGENLARKEDIESLVKEVRAVTAATKEIETKLSGELWNRQRVWEMKRELLFDAARKATEATITLTSCSAAKAAKNPEVWREAMWEFVGDLEEFQIAISMAALVCSSSRETQEELNNVFQVLAELEKQIRDDEGGHLDVTKTDYEAVFGRATKLIRKELQVDS